MSESVDAAAFEAATADDVPAPVPAPADLDMGDEGDAPDAPDAPVAENAAVEEEEFRFGARSVKVPKGAVPEELATVLRETVAGMSADYTRKSQENAERERALRASQEALERAVSLSREAQTAMVAAQTFDAHAKALREKLPTLWQSDMDQARRVSDEAAYYEAAAADSRNQVAKHQADWQAEQQRETARLIERGHAEVRAAIPGFDATAEAALIRYAVETYGIPEADARNYSLTPKVAVAMHKAMQWDRLQAANKAALAAKPPAAPAAPVKAVVSRGASSLNEDNMSDEEFFRARMSKAARARR